MGPLAPVGPTEPVGPWGPSRFVPVLAMLTYLPRDELDKMSLVILTKLPLLPRTKSPFLTVCPVGMLIYSKGRVVGLSSDALE